MNEGARHLLCLFLQKVKNKQETWGERNQTPDLAGLSAVAITDFTTHGHGHDLLHHAGLPHGLRVFLKLDYIANTNHSTLKSWLRPKYNVLKCFQKSHEMILQRSACEN